MTSIRKPPYSDGPTMLSRTLVSVGSLVMLNSALPKVNAVEADKPNQTDSQQVTDNKEGVADQTAEVISLKNSVKKVDRKIPINEFPIYGDPPAVELVYIPEKEEALRQYVSVVRQEVWKQLDNFEGAWNRVKNTYRATKQYGEDLSKYLREDAGALPRATFITVSGLGGIVAGYKGGVFRKTFYASAGMLGAAAVCYPYQAVDISKQGWLLTKDQAKQLWNQARSTTDKTPLDLKKDTDSSKKIDSNITKSEDIKNITNTKDTVKVADPKQLEQTEQPKKDFGMSKAEDKDMYSTRES